MGGSLVQTFSSASFEAEVLQSPSPVLVDFWAEWCGSCQMTAPLIEEVASEQKGRVKVGRVDIDQNQDLAVSYNIRTIPTILLFKDGILREQMMGKQSKRDLIAKLNSLIS